MRNNYILILILSMMNLGCSSHLARGFCTHHYLMPQYRELYPGVQSNDFDSIYDYLDFPFSLVWDTILLVPDVVNAPFDNYGE